MGTKGFPGGSDDRVSPSTSGSIPGLGRFPGKGNGSPLQYSGLENSMDCIVHAVANSWTRLSKFHFISFLIFKLLLHFMGFPGGSDSKKFACYAGDLGLIPGLRRSPGGGHGNPLQYSCLGESQWTEEPSGLQFMGSQRV